MCVDFSTVTAEATTEETPDLHGTIDIMDVEVGQRFMVVQTAEDFYFSHGHYIRGAKNYGLQHEFWNLKEGFSQNAWKRGQVTVRLLD